MGLTGKQKLFIKEYLIDKNGARAAKAAGYNGNEDTLKAVACENLTKPYIASAIGEGLAEQLKNSEKRAAARGITRERWLKKLEMIAFANMQDFATVESKKIKRWEGSDEDGEMISEIHKYVDLKLTKDQKRGHGHAVRKLTETTTQHGGSHGIELHNPIPALEIIGRAYGWIKDDLPVSPHNVNLVITLPSNGREIKK